MIPAPSLARTILPALTLLAMPACSHLDVPLWGPGGQRSARLYEVETVRNVAYYRGPDADDGRHRLDLFLPNGCANYPVVMLVHGGAWMLGDKSCCGLYSSVGEFLASQGVGVVMPGYRLSPWVKHPEHVKDVARAFAWTKAHAAEYGGDPDRLFLAGHSAGGHLVALLATDDAYLKAEGLSTADVKGVVGVGGVYDIPPGDFDADLGGAGPRAFRLCAMFPLRGSGDQEPSRPLFDAGPTLSLNVFGPAFGDDVSVRAAASPVSHVRAGLPPFLLISAENDLPALPGMADEFHAALVKAGNESRRLTVKGRNHNSVMFRAVEADDPVAAAVLEFVRSRSLPAGGGGP
jgi:acetyl esterase/lipase